MIVMRVLCLVGVLLSSIGGALAADDLPRRGSIGVQLKAVPAENTVEIISIFNPALKDQVQPGDRLVSVNGVPYQLGVPLPRVPAGESLAVQFRRGDKVFAVTVPTVAAPVPEMNGKPAELGHVTLKDGSRMRTIIVRPVSDALTKGGKAPGVMIVQGINCGAVDNFGNPDQVFVKLFSLLSQAGFAVMMVDKPGNGDSEGPSCADTGFNLEMEAYVAAAKAFAADKGVDGARMSVVGLSMGGVQAPLIGNEIGAKALVTWGATAMPWYDYLLVNFRRRIYLEGREVKAQDAIQQSWRKVIFALVVEGKSFADVRATMAADLAAIEPEFGDIEFLAGRSWTFQRECDQAGVAVAWDAYRGKLLAMHGEYDWVGDEPDHRLAVEIVNRNTPGAAQFEIIPGVDHLETFHKSRADSFANFGQGEPKQIFAQRTAEWLTSVYR